MSQERIKKIYLLTE